MRTNTNRRAIKATARANPIQEYIAALHEIYPRAIGNTSVTVRPNYAVIVHVPLPKRVSERMRLFDQMAEVGTRILLETDEYIILSGWFDNAGPKPRKNVRRN